MSVKYKHLTHEDRKNIEFMLYSGKSFKEIARVLDADPTTISKEVRRNRIPSDVGAVGRVKNRCIHRRNCDKSKLCDNRNLKECYYNRCSACSLCNRFCPDYVEEKCPKLSHPPYVCNCCPSKSSCVLMKFIYDHDHAHKCYLNRLTGTRTGFRLNLEEISQYQEYRFAYEGQTQGKEKAKEFCC